jgi:hypothetical protein
MLTGVFPARLSQCGEVCTDHSGVDSELQITVNMCSFEHPVLLCHHCRITGPSCPISDITGSPSRGCTVDQLSTIVFNWLRLSTSHITLTNLHIPSKIYVSAHAKLTCMNCTFEPVNDRVEITVEIFAASQAKFSSCTFMKSNKAAIAFRDSSRGKVCNCRFQSSQGTSILAMDRSFVSMHACKFEGLNQFGIYLHRHSSARLENCRFASFSGKGICLL